MHGFVICEYEKVKEYFPQFDTMMTKLETELLSHAREKWGPRYGGFTPTGGQYGKTTIMPQLFCGYGGVATGAALTTWLSNYTATGAATLIQGRRTGGTLPEDYMIGLGGLALLSKAIKITEIKMQIGDRKIPRLNIEEAMAYNKPAVVFEEGYILDEEEGFEVRGNVQSLGLQRLKLIGLQLNRVPNKVQVTNAGAAL